jgi:hypothetical protein
VVVHSLVTMDLSGVLMMVMDLSGVLMMMDLSDVLMCCFTLLSALPSSYVLETMRLHTWLYIDDILLLEK